MSILKRISSLLAPMSPVDRALCTLERDLLRAALKDASSCNLRLSTKVQSLEADVVSLRRGTPAPSFHQHAAEALEAVIDECRELLGVDGEEIALPKAIARRLERSSGEVHKALEGERNAVAKVRKLEEVLATSERVGGVNGAARLILHCGDREPLSSAAARVMSELEAATAKAIELEGARVTLATRVTDLEADVARLTSELELERAELEELEDKNGPDGVADRGDEVGLPGILTELRVAAEEARKERDVVALDRDAKGREAFTLKAKIAELRVLAGVNMGETLEAAIERLRDKAERAA